MDRTLPPWKTFLKAFALLRERPRFALHIGWPYLLLSVLVGLAIDGGVLSAPRVAAGDAPVPGNAIEVGEELADVALTLAQLLLWSVLAVFWHRNLLLGERAAPSVPLRFDRPLGRYILQGLKLSLVTIGFAVLLVASLLAAAFTLPGFADALRTQDMLVLLPAALPWLLVLMVVTFRLGLALPAAAVGEAGFGLRDSWRATRGHTLSIAALQTFVMVLGVGWGAIAFAAGQLIAGQVAVPYAVSYAITGLVSLFFVVLGLSLLTLAYERLVGNHSPEQTRAPLAATTLPPRLNSLLW